VEALSTCFPVLFVPQWQIKLNSLLGNKKQPFSQKKTLI
jgi:hypothetical protein